MPTYGSIGSSVSNGHARSIIIVGAGVFGLTAARALRRRGWMVDVIDPGPVPRPAAASTDISKVIRADYGADALFTSMADAALAGWERWNARWPAALYHQDGFLVLAAHPMQPGDFELESYTLLQARGHPVERLDALRSAGRFPAWSQAQYPDGYFNPRAGWAESGNVVARLAAEAAAAGVRLHADARFDRLLETDSRVTGVRTADGRDLRAEAVLVAAGAWTPTLLPDLSHVMWATGQPVVHLAVPDPRPWQPPRFPVWAADISHAGWYGFPALDDGTLKIARHGAGRRVDPDGPRTILPEEEAWFHDFLRAHLPAAAGAPVRATRLCLYCDTFDGNFWIDHHPARPGLIVAAGDSGHAFKFAPVLGPLIADVVEQKPNQWRARFAWRDRGPDGREAARSAS